MLTNFQILRHLHPQYVERNYCASKSTLLCLALSHALASTFLLYFPSNFKEIGVLVPSLAEHSLATQALAVATHTPFIDVTLLSVGSLRHVEPLCTALPPLEIAEVDSLYAAFTDKTLF